MNIYEELTTLVPGLQLGHRMDIAVELIYAELVRLQPKGVYMEQKPSVGRIVHYQSYGTPGGEYKSEPRAAIITDVQQPNQHGELYVSLTIFNPKGFFLNESVPYSETPKPGHWNWPPRI